MAETKVTPAELDKVFWEELGRHTLGSSADTMSVASFAARKYLQIIISAIATGGTANANITFNGDTGNNYTRRSSSNGGADTTAPSIGFIAGTASAVAYPFFTIADVMNIAAQEKQVLMRAMSQGPATAANEPNRMELVGKWANTSAQITTITLTNTGTGDFASGSEVVVLGHN